MNRLQKAAQRVTHAYRSGVGVDASPALAQVMAELEAALIESTRADINPIQFRDLSTRARAVLCDLGEPEIATLNKARDAVKRTRLAIDVLQRQSWTRKALLLRPGCGPKCADEIEAFAASHGVALS